MRQHQLPRSPATVLNLGQTHWLVSPVVRYTASELLPIIRTFWKVLFTRQGGFERELMSLAFQFAFSVGGQWTESQWAYRALGIIHVKAIGCVLNV